MKNYLEVNLSKKKYDTELFKRLISGYKVSILILSPEEMDKLIPTKIKSKQYGEGFLYLILIIKQEGNEEHFKANQIEVKFEDSDIYSSGLQDKMIFRLYNPGESVYKIITLNTTRDEYSRLLKKKSVNISLERVKLL